MHGDTDLCQMIHVYLANNQIFCLFRLMNLCPLPPSGKPTHTGQFMVLPFFFKYLNYLNHMRQDTKNNIGSVQPFAAGCESRKPDWPYQPQLRSFSLSALHRKSRFALKQSNFSLSFHKTYSWPAWKLNNCLHSWQKILLWTTGLVADKNYIPTKKVKTDDVL